MQLARHGMSLASRYYRVLTAVSLADARAKFSLVRKQSGLPVREPPHGYFVLLVR
jgi:hypothetical protein